jgi:hypothetical protein
MRIRATPPLPTAEDPDPTRGREISTLARTR